MTPEEQEAAELLPCAYDNSCIEHQQDCPAHYRPAVAERLRQRDKRIAALEAENERLRGRFALIEQMLCDKALCGHFTAEEIREAISGVFDDEARAALAGRK